MPIDIDIPSDTLQAYAQLSAHYVEDRKQNDRRARARS